MKNNYLLFVSLLSCSSVIMLYLGSRPETTAVYGKIRNLRDRFPCCKALTKECMACAAGMLVHKFCEQHPGRYRCPEKVTTLATPVATPITLFIVNDKANMDRYKKNTITLERYAKKNGYSLLNKSPEDEPRCNHVKHFFFKKHCTVYYHIMDNGVTNDRWYFVLDGDNAVRNPNTNIKLETFIKNDKDLLYYYRFHNNEIMAGNYAIKNTKWAMDYLKNYYELHNTYRGLNWDNGALHYYLLPRQYKDSCNKFCSKKEDWQLYFKFVGCVHKHLQMAGFPLRDHIFVYQHGTGWSYDGWVVDYKWSNETLIHHAMKRPPMKGRTYDNKYTSEKVLKQLLIDTLRTRAKKLPNTGWQYTKNGWTPVPVTKVTTVAPVAQRVSKLPKIMIGIPVHDRQGYVSFSSKVLARYNHVDPNDIFVFDDASTEYDEKKLREWYGKDIKYFRSSKRLGADANTRRLFTYFSESDYDILLTLDSDLILDEKWKQFIHDHIDKSGVLSLYHSAIGHHKTFNCNGNLCEKKSMGNAGAVMTKSIVVDMLKNHKSTMFDWGWVAYFKSRGIKMYVPKNSLVLHYGKRGQNNGCGTSELARGFDRNALPSWIKLRLFFYFDQCKKSNILYPTKTIIIVLSHREAFEERQVIRDTWAKNHDNVYFVVGKPCDIPPKDRKPWVCEIAMLKSLGNDNTYALEQSRISKQLLEENDVVHVDMIDVYRNLAEKLKLAYKWVFKTHGEAYVVKVDLDTFVRVAEVEKFVNDRDIAYECIVGGISHGKVERHGKWAETKYKKDKYPPFPYGSGHIVSPDLLKYIVTHEMVTYQGEDTTLGIFFDDSDIDVTFTVTKSIITHSGDCFNKKAMIVGHDIGVSKMKECNYNLDYPNGMKRPLSWSQYGQDRYIAKALPKGKYFVEIGGYDGEKFSNTLLLEKEYGWNGLLVEANPYTYNILKSRNRNAKSANACIGTGSLTFKISGSTTSALELITDDHLKRVNSDINVYGKSGDKRWAHSGEEVTTNCVSILTLLESTDIDYFSLDVEGGELYILKHLEWDKLNIKMFSIEVDQHKTEIIEFMKSKGYKIETELRGDIIFKKTRTPRLTDFIEPIDSSVESVVINIGTHKDPIAGQEGELVLLFEPIVEKAAAEFAKRNDARTGAHSIVIPAAISNMPAYVDMNIYNNGASSSIAKAASKQHWNTNTKRGDGNIKRVPVLKASDIFEYIPKHVTIRHMKTDMQGFDFTAISSVHPNELRRVQTLKTEVYLDVNQYSNVQNDFCRQWLPFMKKNGWKIDTLWSQCNYKTWKGVEAENICLQKDKKSCEYDANWLIEPRLEADKADEVRLHEINRLKEYGKTLPGETFLTMMKSPKLFLCGYRLDYISFIYPDRSVETYDKAKSSTTNDVLLNGLGGPSCDLGTFKGKIIHVNGESTMKVPSNTFGPGGNVFYYVQAAFQRIPNALNLITNRPKNTKEKFMYYAQRNCVKHREDAFDKLSTIKRVDAVGACKNNVASTGFPDRSKWQSSNWKYPFTRYRFSLCMENKNVAGYITEKLLMAFLAGTIPVYYGTEEVFDIFNRDAFIYYDVENPEKAVAKIKFLEQNPVEYDKMLNEPILNTGSYERYFSKEAITRILTNDSNKNIFFMYDDDDITMSKWSKICDIRSTSDIDMYAQLRKHPLRTLNPTNAEIFIVPMPIYQSFKCDPKGHVSRIERGFNTLFKSKWFNNGINHLIGGHNFLFSGWAANEKFIPTRIWKQMEKMTVTRYEVYNSSKWHKTTNPRDPVSLYGANWERTKHSIVTPYSDHIGVPLITKMPSVKEWKFRQYFIWYHTRKADSAHGATILRKKPLETTCEHCNIGYDIPKQEWVQGWKNSRFCLVIRGDTPTSHAFYNAIRSFCIPVIISDGFEDVGFPFRNRLNIDAFSVKVTESDFLNGGINVLMKRLNNLENEAIQKKLLGLKAVQGDLITEYKNGRVVDNILQAMTMNLIHCASIPEGIMWDTFTNILTILNQMNAPYNLHAGTLLSWYRDCSLGGSDIDFTIDLSWFTKNNAQLKTQLLNQGWKQRHVFGTFGKPGYEEAWVKNKIKVDLFSQTLLNGRYTTGLTVDGITYPCMIEKYGTEVVKWGNLSMKVPIPIEGALKSLYNDWKTPVKNYAWHINPFKKGNQCTKSFTL